MAAHAFARQAGANVATVAVLLDDAVALERRIARGIVEAVHAGAGGLGAAGGRSPWNLLVGIAAAVEADRGFAGCDGVIGRVDDPRLQQATHRHGLIAVGLDVDGAWQPGSGDGLADVVATDADAIAQLALDHFAACGLRLVACASSAARHAAVADAFVGRAAAAGLECHRSLTLRQARRTTADLRLGEQCIPWLGGITEQVGILVTCDRLGWIVVDAARRAGRRLPDDVAVITVGNDDLVCESAAPTLTSVDPGLAGLGVAAVRRLGERFAARQRRGHGGPPPVVRVAPAGLMARGSTDVIGVSDPTVREALLWLRSRLGAETSVVQIARRVGVSRSTLEQRFRRATSGTVHDAIVSARLAAVQRLLGDESLTLKQVASSCGFGSVQYMNTFIKRHTGSTPGQLRDRQAIGSGH